MSLRKLKGVDDIGEFSTSENVAENIIRYFDWGFVNAGGFFNVNIPASSIYGGDKDLLTPVSDFNYSDGQLWEAGRKNWVWESGVDVDTEPVMISGVYVDDVFYPSNSSGTYAHYYNYNLGQVVFDSPIPTGSSVQLEYAYKYVTVVDASTIPFFSRLQNTGFSFTNELLGSGDILLSGENRLQLPVVAIEIPPIAETKGYELGSGSRYAYHTLRFHVISNSPQVNRKLSDIIIDQQHQTIYMYDLNTVISSGEYPLDERGMTIENVKSYPEIITDYAWKRLRIRDGQIGSDIQQINHGLYMNTTRLYTQAVLNSV